MNSIKISITIFILSFLTSSRAQTTEVSPLTKIHYRYAGGDVGIYANLEIRKDSTICVWGRPNKKNVYKGKTAAALWQSLTDSISLEDFEEIESSAGLQYIDRIDSFLKVEAEKRSYSFMNGKIDENENKKVYQFMAKVRSELTRVSNKRN